MTSERMVRRPYHSSAWMRRQQRGVTQGFVGAAIRSLGSHQLAGQPAGSPDSANGLLRYATRA